MTLISLNEAKWKLDMVDQAVEKGMFRSRAEAYRTGVLMLLAMPKVLQSKLSDFGLTTIQTPIQDAFSSIREGQIEGAIEALGNLNRALMMQSCMLLMSGSDQAEDFETEFVNVSKYRDVLIRFSQYDTDTQEIIKEDLTRDLKRISEWIRLSGIAKSREEKNVSKDTITACLQALETKDGGSSYVEHLERVAVIDTYGLRSDEK